MHRLIVFLLLSTSWASAEQAETSVRDYWAPLSANQEQQIAYVVSKLANDSYLSLLWHRRDIERAGEYTRQVHPLKFLRFTLSHPALKQDLSKMSGIPWGNFKERFANSLAETARRHNIQQDHLVDFAEVAGFDPQELVSLADSGEWEAFMELVAHHTR